MRHGIWAADFHSNVGPMPCAAEGAQMCSIGKKQFIFGGFSRRMFNELRQFDSEALKWT